MRAMVRMTLIMLGFVALTATGVQAQADDQDERLLAEDLVSLGFGRSRLRFVLGERQALGLGDSGQVAVGQLPFLDRWLQRELPRRIEGLES
ncbi:MAG: hypothetical protein KDB53_03620, partial [Planctomycetes bacterium]|nr:hypothetical protein [Planctomycetota bacterium]